MKKWNTKSNIKSKTHRPRIVEEISIRPEVSHQEKSTTHTRGTQKFTKTRKNTLDFMRFAQRSFFDTFLVFSTYCSNFSRNALWRCKNRI